MLSGGAWLLPIYRLYPHRCKNLFWATTAYSLRVNLPSRMSGERVLQLRLNRAFQWSQARFDISIDQLNIAFQIPFIRRFQPFIREIYTLHLLISPFVMYSLTLSEHNNNVLLRTKLFEK
jgi:hypothetical protein